MKRSFQRLTLFLIFIIMLPLILRCGTGGSFVPSADLSKFTKLPDLSGPPNQDAEEVWLATMRYAALQKAVNAAPSGQAKGTLNALLSVARTSLIVTWANVQVELAGGHAAVGTINGSVFDNLNQAILAYAQILMVANSEAAKLDSFTAAHADHRGLSDAERAQVDDALAADPSTLKF